MSSLRDMILRMTETIKPVSGAATKETVKTIARGMPGVSGVTVVTTCVLSTFAHKAAGAPSAWHSLRPLTSEGGIFTIKLARIAWRERGSVPEGNALFEKSDTILADRGSPCSTG
ncbi:MAG: hypothetical protein ABSG88_20485 [Bradyrhizobium sp.]